MMVLKQLELPMDITYCMKEMSIVTRYKIDIGEQENIWHVPYYLPAPCFLRLRSQMQT